jgi:hypothetical protein
MPDPKSQSRSNNREPHALLGRLLAHGAGADAHAFRGYIGPETRDGKVRLYPSLGDLTFSIEIAEADILESVAAPETLLPHGGVVLWVKRDAEVVFHGSEVTTISVRSLRHSGGRPLAQPAQAVGSVEPRTGAARFVEVQRGRLQIRLRQGAARYCASCSCSSCGPCGVCSSTGCQSTCGPLPQ